MPSRFLNRGPFTGLRMSALAAVVALAATAAMQSASTERSGPSSLFNLPVAAVEPRAPARVIAEAPLWKFVGLTTCNSNSTTCFGRLPYLRAKERWVIQFVSCTTDTAFDASFRHFSLQVTDREVTKLLGFHFLAATYQSPREQAAVYVASQPMVLSLEPGSVLYVTALSSGQLGGGQCNVTGVRQKLE